ncbi:hypothetical protein [Streptomyces sp. NPDC014734]|uniref:hypothetical protein n=1 Tax=Streptomyces sp. NPDC014734 TaxID=3364886 RepID=UPI0036FE5EAF
MSAADAADAPFGTTAGVPNGVLTAASTRGGWAWVAVRLAPAALLDEHRGYADVPEARRLAEAVHGESAWLQSLLTPGAGLRFELRVRNDPPSGLLHAALLGQVRAADEHAAVRAALALRDRLAYTPRHVRAEAVTDTAEVRHWLAPLTPHPQGLAELRKPLAHAPCTRNDTGRAVSFAVSPLAAGARSWEPVWAELGRLAFPALFGVCLEPYAPGEDVRAAFGALAQEYAHLSVPGPVRPTWNAPAPPDAFAGRAVVAARDAMVRYAGPAFRARASLAGAGPLPPGLAEQIAAAAGGAVVRRPPVEEAGPAWANIAGLNRNWLDATYGQGAPARSLNPVERLLADLLDVSEAATALRLPYEAAGHQPLFATPERVPDPRAGHGMAAGRRAGPYGEDPGAPRFDV